MACGLRGAGPIEYVRAALAAHRAAVAAAVRDRLRQKSQMA